MKLAKDYFEKELESQVQIVLDELKAYKEEELIYQMVYEDTASMLMRKEQNILDIQEDVF